MSRRTVGLCHKKLTKREETGCSLEADFIMTMNRERKGQSGRDKYELKPRRRPRWQQLDMVRMDFGRLRCYYRAARNYPGPWAIGVAFKRRRQRGARSSRGIRQIVSQQAQDRHMCASGLQSLTANQSATAHQNIRND
jgi:hypothetical protein